MEERLSLRSRWEEKECDNQPSGKKLEKRADGQM
jgi:hypothetical protein